MRSRSVAWRMVTFPVSPALMEVASPLARAGRMETARKRGVSATRRAAVSRSVSRRGMIPLS